MIVARSSPECRLYMELHPCECGTASFEQRHWLEEREEDLLAIYEGPCRGCKKTRRFELALAADLPPAPPAFGGSDPSTIIDAGEFLQAAEKAASEVPDDVASLPPHLRVNAKKTLGVAIAALEEVLKFMKDGDDRVPPAAFRSERSRAMLVDGPSRFDRMVLLAQLEKWRMRLKSI